MKPEKFINQGGKEGGGVSNPLNDVLLHPGSVQSFSPKPKMVKYLKFRPPPFQ